MIESICSLAFAIPFLGVLGFSCGVFASALMGVNVLAREE